MSDKDFHTTGRIVGGLWWIQTFTIILVSFGINSFALYHVFLPVPIIPRIIMVLLMNLTGAQVLTQLELILTSCHDLVETTWHSACEFLYTIQVYTPLTRHSLHRISRLQFVI